MDPPEAELAGPGDARRLGRTLALAFQDDPIQAWLFPTSEAYRRGSEPIFRETARAWARTGQVWTNSERTGAAVWVPPGPPKLSRWSQLRMNLVGWYALRDRAAVAGRAFARMARKHPKEPHWYLMSLGTEPAHQGRGVAGGLMRPVLERCDREGLPAWLESSKPENVPYYEARGFEVVEEMPIAEGGPPLWLMLRRPA